MSHLAAILKSISDRWTGLSSIQKSQLVWISAGTVICAALLSWWVMRPDWQTLYSGLTPDEARQIGSVLSASNTSYQVSTNGDTLLVPQVNLNKDRLITASKASGKSVRQGYEIFDKPDWAGSDYDEKINYQRALEGELEQTIDTLSAVQSSRVHLVLLQESLFSEEQRSAKASVILRLKGQRLDPVDGEAIRNLIASAVDGLGPEHVVLLDTNGQQITGRNHQTDDREVYEQLLSQHILQTLEPAVGVGNVRVAVTVDFDHFSHDNVAELYDPTSVVTLSMQRSDQTTAMSPPALGIPGTSSNAPNQQLPLLPSQRGENQTGKQESAAYGASKKTQHSEGGPGNVERISAAIIINEHPPSLEGNKKATPELVWTQDQMKAFINLSEAAIGYKESRGDSVVLQELPFESSLLPGPSKFQIVYSQVKAAQPVLEDVLLSVVFIVAMLFVIKPIMTKLLAVRGENVISASIDSNTDGSRHAEILKSSGEQLAFDQVSSKIQHDSEQSTRVLQAWIHAE